MRAAPSLAARLALLVVLCLVPLGLRLWPIAHGAPYSYVPDTHIVRNALGMAKDKDLIPPVNKYSSYPNFLPYVLLPVYAGEYVWGRVTGRWSGTEQFKDRVLEAPIFAHLPARVTLAVLASLAALAAFGAARAAGLTRGAWVAGWLAGTSLLHVHMSVQERPWAPLATALLFTAWPAIVHARTGSRRSLLWAGVAAGVSFAILQAGLAALVIAGLAWLVAPAGAAGGWRGRALASRVRLGFATVGVALLIAVPLGHPYWIKYGPTRGAGRGAGLVTDAHDTFAFAGTQIPLGFRAETFENLSRTLFGYDPVLLVLALAGLVPALRRRALWPPVLFALAWGAFFMTNPNEHVRYVLPLAALLVLPAAVAGEALAAHRIGRVALVVLCAVPLVQALRLGYVLRHADTRALALPLLAELPAASRVAIDVYGPIPPRNAAALAVTASLRVLYGRELHRKESFAAGGAPPGGAGLDTIGLEDAFEYDLRHGGTWIRPEAARYGATTAEVLHGLGATHLLLVDRTPDDGREPPLVDPTPSIAIEGAEPGAPPAPKLAPLALEGAPLWTLEPNASRGGRRVPARDGHLPTEMSFPLTDLWAIERPGPKLTLWAL
ncbi:MAG: hypothetical protein R3F49_12245 [Planctomycetota bacterium]